MLRYALVVSLFACTHVSANLIRPAPNNNRKLKCTMGPWSQWGACSKPCNGGKQTRTRGIKVIPKPLTRRDCPKTKQTRACNKDVFCYWFELSGGDGTEVVEIINGGKTEMVSLTKEGQSFGVNDPHVTVNFVTGLVTTLPKKPVDLAGSFGGVKTSKQDEEYVYPETVAHHVIFKWGDNKLLGATRCDRNSSEKGPLDTGCKGEGPTLPYLWDDWQCENYVRDVSNRNCLYPPIGYWIWAGEYEFTFKTSLPAPAPTAKPMPAPTASSKETLAGLLGLN